MIGFELVKAGPRFTYVKDISFNIPELKSLTNGAEALVEYLFQHGQIKNSDHLYYLDSYGERVDEMLHADGKFIDFKPGYFREEVFFDHYKSFWFWDDVKANLENIHIPIETPIYV